MDAINATSKDWFNTFIPAIQFLLSGSNPYAAHFYNPPWVLGFLIPFSEFPWGRELMLLSSSLAFALIAMRLGASPVGVCLWVLSPLTFNAILLGNVEWISLLGLAVNPMLGLILFAIKPQVSIAIMAFVIIETWRNFGWKRVALLLLPLITLILVSLVTFGPWPLDMLRYTDNRGTANDHSLFPWSIPVGLILFVLSLRTRNIRYAIAASPFFFPVITLQCWLVVLLALVSSTRKIAFASVGLWTVTLAFVMLN